MVELIAMLTQKRYTVNSMNTSLNVRYCLKVFMLFFVLMPWISWAAPLPKKNVLSAYLAMLDREPTKKELKEAQGKYSVTSKLLNFLNKSPERSEVLKKNYQKLLNREIGRKDLNKASVSKISISDLQKKLLDSLERQEIIKYTFSRIVCRPPTVAEITSFNNAAVSISRLEKSLETGPEKCPPMETAEGNGLYVRINGPREVGLETLEIILDAGSSYSQTGRPLKFAWSVLDGVGVQIKNQDQSKAVLVLPRDLSYNELYAVPGDYKIRLIVNDGQVSAPVVGFNVKVKPLTTAEEKMIEKVNNLRIGLGLSSLKFNSKLAAAARKYAYYLRLNVWFDHNDKEGRGPDKRAVSEGYDYELVGENLGVIRANRPDLELNDENLQIIFDAWVKSPTHYENMVRRQFQEIGLGFSVGQVEYQDLSFHLYAAQEFGLPFDEAVREIEELLN